MILKTQPRDRWDIESDVRTLENARAIRKDPQRLKDAQNMIREKRASESAILNMKPTSSPKRANPATRGPLNVPWN